MIGPSVAPLSNSLIHEMFGPETPSVLRLGLRISAERPESSQIVTAAETKHSTSRIWERPMIMELDLLDIFILGLMKSNRNLGLKICGYWMMTMYIYTIGSGL